MTGRRFALVPPRVGVEGNVKKIISEMLPKIERFLYLNPSEKKVIIYISPSSRFRYLCRA